MKSEQDGQLQEFALDLKDPWVQKFGLLNFVIKQAAGACLISPRFLKESKQDDIYQQEYLKQLLQLFREQEFSHELCELTEKLGTELGHANFDSAKLDLAFSRFFIGPPRPAVLPWASAYLDKKETSFGSQTFALKSLLAHKGFELSKSMHQHEDHIGLELAALVLLAEEFAQDLNAVSLSEILDFIDKFLLSWLDEYIAAFQQLSDELRLELAWFGIFVPWIKALLEELRVHCLLRLEFS